MILVGLVANKYGEIKRDRNKKILKFESKTYDGYQQEILFYDKIIQSKIDKKTPPI